MNRSFALTLLCFSFACTPNPVSPRDTSVDTAPTDPPLPAVEFSVVPDTWITVPGSSSILDLRFGTSPPPEGLEFDLQPTVGGVSVAIRPPNDSGKYEVDLIVSTDAEIGLFELELIGVAPNYSPGSDMVSLEIVQAD